MRTRGPPRGTFITLLLNSSRPPLCLREDAGLAVCSFLLLWLTVWVAILVCEAGTSDPQGGKYPSYLRGRRTPVQFLITSGVTLHFEKDLSPPSFI